MPLPQLGLSLSITDNSGSPMYSGKGEREKISDYDSAPRQHTITIIISDEKVNEVELNVNNKNLHKVMLPTYKMMVTDDKTEERTYFEVTRDSLLLNELKVNKTGRFNFLGMKLFKKTVYMLPVITFEPLNSVKEIFEVTKYRIKKDNYLSYTLHRNTEKAFLVSGLLPENFIKTTNCKNFFYVEDRCQGQKFIRDIFHREKFIKTIPKVEVHLIKRQNTIKEYELNKLGKVNKIIYL